MATEVEKFLKHAGVKGMKWGQRKAVDTSSSSPKAKKAKGQNSIKELVRRSEMSKISKRNGVNERFLSGKGSALDIMKVVGSTSTGELLVNKGSLKTIAAKRLKNGQAAMDRWSSGKANAGDKAVAFLTTSVADLVAARK